MEVAHHQIEPAVVSRRDAGRKPLHVTIALQPARDELAAAAPRCQRQRLSHIGQHGQAPMGAQTQPGATVAQVAPPHHLGAVVQLPAVQRRCGPIQEFVAVGGDQQRAGRIGVQRKGDQAHIERPPPPRFARPP
ncbi:hypothetical protein D9M68_920390 [compost metagenome]